MVALAHRVRRRVLVEKRYACEIFLDKSLVCSVLTSFAVRGIAASFRGGSRGNRGSHRRSEISKEKKAG